MTVEKTLLFSYLLTVIVELGMALLWRLRDGRSLLAIGLINTVTNPPLVLGHFILSILLPARKVRLLIYLAEICIVFLEGFLCKKTVPALKRPWLFSLCANAVSFLAGILFSALL